MRTPSENLRQQLRNLGLCSAAQLAACRKEVDRLCDGLPDFDSVWLDVLVQRRILSRFQADRLQQNSADGLQIDQLILREQLGDRSFLAVTPTDQPVVIQRRSIGSQSDQEALDGQLQKLHSKRKTAPQSLAVPIRLVKPESEAADPRCFVAGPYQSGWTVAELIVRGGRLPWSSVLSIGHQLLQALDWLHRQGCCHGNITSSNVRITPDGDAVLVGALGSSFGEGGISLSANLTYEEIRFVAPERILNLQPADFQSDLYSLSSVLWNLLSGRDAFLSTDPVRRITKAGQENLPDIRNLVPDCPVEMSVALQRFSKSNPQLRPANGQQAIAMLQNAGSGSRHHVRNLVKSLPDHSNTYLRSKGSAVGSNSLATVAVAGLMIATFVGYGVHRGLIPSVASMTSSVDTAQPAPASSDVHNLDVAKTSGGHDLTDHSTGVLPMPQPDAAGVIVLQSGRTYVAEDRRFPGVMHVEASGMELARVLVASGQSWNLNARQLAISNIHVLQGTTSSIDSGSPAGVLANAEQANPEQANALPTSVRTTADVVSIRRCIIESTVADHKSVCLHWATSTGTTATVQLKDCVFRSNGSAVSTSVVPQRFHLDNTLMLVKRSVVRATLPAGSSVVWAMTLNRVTQPRGLTFADFLLPDRNANPCRTILTAGESVLAPSLALIQIASAADQAAIDSEVEFRLPERGNAVVVPPDLPVAVAWDNSLRTVVAIADDNVLADSILPAEPVFRAIGRNSLVSVSNPWSGFQLVDYEGPKLTSELQGVLVDQLPVLESQDNSEAR